MRAGRLQYRGQTAPPTGSSVAPGFTNAAASNVSTQSGAQGARPPLITLGLLVVAMVGLSWWTREGKRA